MVLKLPQDGASVTINLGYGLLVTIVTFDRSSMWNDYRSV